MGILNAKFDVNVENEIYKNFDLKTWNNFALLSKAANKRAAKAMQEACEIELRKFNSIIAEKWHSLFKDIPKLLQVENFSVINKYRKTYIRLSEKYSQLIQSLEHSMDKNRAYLLDEKIESEEALLQLIIPSLVPQVADTILLNFLELAAKNEPNTVYVLLYDENWNERLKTIVTAPQKEINTQTAQLRFFKLMNIILCNLNLSEKIIMGEIEGPIAKMMMSQDKRIITHVTPEQSFKQRYKKAKMKSNEENSKLNSKLKLESNVYESSIINRGL